jgi:hypothetical protein
LHAKDGDMNKARKALIAAVGAMTPAFIIQDQAAARTIEGIGTENLAGCSPTLALDREALKNGLLEFSPGDKLRIAGDRIRLAEAPKTGNNRLPCTNNNSGCAVVSGVIAAKPANPKPNANTGVGMTVPGNRSGNVPPVGGAAKH